MLPTYLHPFSALAALTQALPSKRATASANFCGAPNDYQVIDNTPWIVYSMNYNYGQIVGSCCTGFTGLSTSTSGEQTIEWNSTWRIAEDDNADLVKGYSFVGLTQNLENKIQDIESIPATYTWSRTNSTEYKGESYPSTFFISIV